METNLAAEDHGCPEHLTRVREADIGLKLYTKVQTSADQVDATKRVLENGDASVLNISLRDADALVSCS
jgi:hypothetical protein